MLSFSCPRFCSYCLPEFGESGVDTICLPSAVPGLRTPTLKQTEFILTRLRSRPPVFGVSFSCGRSGSGFACGLRSVLRCQPKISVAGTPSNDISRDEEALWSCQLLHRRNTDRERRKVRYAPIDRRSSYVAIRHPVAGDKRRYWTIRDSSGQ